MTKDSMPEGTSPPDTLSDDVLARMLARVEGSDPADAPDLAGAIASILANRLEGTPLPEDVEALIASLGAPSGSAGEPPP